MFTQSHSTFKRRTSLLGVLAIAAHSVLPMQAQAATYIFAGELNGTALVTHPNGYSGSSGTIQVTVGIDPTSVNASDMVVPTQNVIRTLNGRVGTTGTLDTSSDEMTGSDVDFESVLLHEMGHSVGLAHVNLATESGLTGDDQNYTKTTDGANNTLELTIGGDGIRGSNDDTRGDDVNMYWFLLGSNDPVGTVPGTVDSTTYSQSLGSLPGGHNFVANSDRDVTSALGHVNTEGIMQQGSFLDEEQRHLTNEAVAAIALQQSGMDRTSGTSDDYTYELVYSGLTTNADIVIDFDNSQTGFAVSDSGGVFLDGDDAAITTNNIYFNTNFNWYYNQTSNEETVDPSNVFVDFNAGSNGVGTENSPFDNLQDAVDVVDPAGNINIEPGSSAETFTGGNTIATQMNLLNNDGGSGTVTVGSIP